MFIRTTLVAAVASVFMLTAGGCAVSRGQETVGAYVDDATITTSVKACRQQARPARASASRR
jgi:archaellin